MWPIIAKGLQFTAKSFFMVLSPHHTFVSYCGGFFCQFACFFTICSVLKFSQMSYFDMWSLTRNTDVLLLCSLLPRRSTTVTLTAAASSSPHHTGWRPMAEVTQETHSDVKRMAVPSLSLHRVIWLSMSEHTLGKNLTNVNMMNVERCTPQHTISRYIRVQSNLFSHARLTLDYPLPHPTPPHPKELMPPVKPRYKRECPSHIRHHLISISIKSCGARGRSDLLLKELQNKTIKTNKQT